MLTIHRDPAAIAAKADADIARAKADASAAVVAWAEQFLDQFTAGYPKQETLAWGAKLAAARKILSGQPDGLIEIEAEALGVPALFLAARVEQLGGRYERIVAVMAALRGRAQAAIVAATDAEALPAIIEAMKAASASALSEP